MARPAKPEPFKKFAAPRLVLDEEGAISNKRMERYALFQADGIVSGKAWALADPKERGTAKNNNTYKTSVDKNKTFKERLAELVTRKEELLAQGIWGRIQWQAEVMYAEARAQGDNGLMVRATDLLLKVAEKMEPGGARPPSGEGTGNSNRGAPPVEANAEEQSARRGLLDRPTLVVGGNAQG